MRRRRIRRFLLWLLPARRVKIEFEPAPPEVQREILAALGGERETEGGPRPGAEGPRALGGWSDLPYE